MFCFVFAFATNRLEFWRHRLFRLTCVSIGGAPSTNYYAKKQKERETPVYAAVIQGVLFMLVLHRFIFFEATAT